MQRPATTNVFSDRFVLLLRLTLVLVLIASIGYYVVFSWHWPILRDTSIMHYVNFLIDHGFRPYRDITDNNLPGAYLADRVGGIIFGTGDLGWRIYDFALLAAITTAMIVIALPCDWVAGVFGGLMFALLHGSEGPDFPVEREEILTALLVVGLAFLILSIRHHRPGLASLFGFLTGAAATIKPTIAPFGLVLLGGAYLVSRRRKEAAAAGVVWGLVGMAVAGVIVLGYLTRYHAFQPLWFVVRTIMPSYVSMGNEGMRNLLSAMMPRNLLPAAAIGVLLAFASRSWNWERWFVLMGVLFGALSYLAQRKGSIYHRYPFVAYLLLFLGLEFMSAMQRHGWRRVLGTAGVLLTLTLSVPHYLVQLRGSPFQSTMPFAMSLTRDLRDLGQIVPLPNKVECLDLTYGCFTALEHLHLVQNNGFTGDLLLFSPVPSRAVDYYRTRFFDLTRKDPPDVLVLSNEWFPQNPSFAKLQTWPEFANYMQANYDLLLARRFPEPGSDATSSNEDQAPAYKIYVLKSLLNQRSLTPSL